MGKRKMLKEPSASNYVELAARMRVTARYSGAADDLRLADEMLAQARTKQLPSTRTEIGAGGELIDREKVGSHRTLAASRSPAVRSRLSPAASIAVPPASSNSLFIRAAALIMP